MNTLREKIDVIVVSHNYPAHQCVTSALASGARVIVVDNSTEEPHLPEGVIFLRSANRGFGAACNSGAALGSAPFVLFLNSDVILGEDTLRAALDAFEAAPQAGLLGVRLVDESGARAQSRMRFPKARHFVDRLGFSRLLTRFSGYHDPNEQTGFADWVLGAFLLARRSAFEAVGGFDERYFLYFEEVDLAKRMADNGWRCVYFNEATAVHVGGGSTRSIKSLRRYYSLCGRFRYAFSHMRPVFAWATVLISLTLEPAVRLVLLLFRPLEAIALCSAYFRAARYIKEARK